MADDFSLLIAEKANVLQVYQSEKHRIYKTQDEKRFNFYFLENGSEQLEKIVNTTKTKEKVEIVS